MLLGERIDREGEKRKSRGCALDHKRDRHSSQLLSVSPPSLSLLGRTTGDLIYESACTSDRAGSVVGMAHARHRLFAGWPKPGLGIGTDSPPLPSSGPRFSCSLVSPVASLPFLSPTPWRLLQRLSLSTRLLKPRRHARQPAIIRQAPEERAPMLREGDTETYTDDQRYKVPK
jgi:hypothetical protein